VAKVKDNSWLADAPDDTAVFEQISDAQRRGRDDLVEKLTDQLRAQKQARQLEQIRKLQNSPDQQYDGDILAAYAKAVAEPPPNTPPPDDEEIYEDGISPTTYNWLRDYSARLGQYPEDSPNSGAFQTTYGGASRNGLILDIYLSFDSLPSGLLALIDWLNQQGCKTFKYSL
jgi:hypothetical protein